MKDYPLSSRDFFADGHRQISPKSEDGVVEKLKYGCFDFKLPIVRINLLAKHGVS
jgi:hypothetical protein